MLISFLPQCLLQDSQLSLPKNSRNSVAGNEQAYGAKSYDLVGHVWQRAMIILGLICVPICGVLLATEKLLLLGGQTPAVAVMTAAYVR